MFLHSHLSDGHKFIWARKQRTPISAFPRDSFSTAGAVHNNILSYKISIEYVQ